MEGLVALGGRIERRTWSWERGWRIFRLRYHAHMGCIIFVSPSPYALHCSSVGKRGRSPVKVDVLGSSALRDH